MKSLLAVAFEVREGIHLDQPHRPRRAREPQRLVAGEPLEHFYDQVAWFTEEKDGSKPLLSLRYTDRAGMFDWSLNALAGSQVTAQQKSFRISDHYPL